MDDQAYHINVRAGELAEYLAALRTAFQWHILTESEFRTKHDRAINQVRADFGLPALEFCWLGAGDLYPNPHYAPRG